MAPSQWKTNLVRGERRDHFGVQPVQAVFPGRDVGLVGLVRVSGKKDLKPNFVHGSKAI